MITANNISLPPIRSVQNALQHVHQSFLVEMGDRDSMGRDVGSHGNGPGSLEDMYIDAE